MTRSIPLCVSPDSKENTSPHISVRVRMRKEEGGEQRGRGRGWLRLGGLELREWVDKWMEVTLAPDWS